MNFSWKIKRVPTCTSAEFSILFACDLPLATNHNIILFKCFYKNLSLSFIVPGGWRGRGQAGWAARWSRLSSPSNNPGLLAGGRGWCGAGLLAAGAGQIPRLSLPSGFTEVTPATRPMQKICNNISAPIKNIKFLNHLAYELHNVDIIWSSGPSQPIMSLGAGSLFYGFKGPGTGSQCSDLNKLGCLQFFSTGSIFAMNS